MDTLISWIWLFIWDREPPRGRTNQWADDLMTGVLVMDLQAHVQPLPPWDEAEASRVVNEARRRNEFMAENGLGEEDMADPLGWPRD